MIFGALAGIIVLSVSGSLPLKEADAILTSGMRMMSFIGFVMIALPLDSALFFEKQDMLNLWYKRVHI